MGEELDGLFETLENDLLSKYQYNLLLNYITNLQKENMKLISENEAIKNIRYTVDETIYKQRNEKAIEYIKENLFEENNGCGCEWQQFPNYEDAKTRLLSTLQGGDE